MNSNIDISNPIKLFNNSRIFLNKSTKNMRKDQVSVKLYLAKSCKANLARLMTYSFSWQAMFISISKSNGLFLRMEKP